MIKRYFLRPAYKTLHLLFLIITFNLDFSSDESIESKRSYSITTMYNRNNSQQDSIMVNKPVQPLVPAANNNNNNSKSNEDVISLRSFDFNNAQAAGGSGEEITYPPKQVDIDDTSPNNSNSSNIKRSSLGKIESEITENGTPASSFTTNGNDTTSDEAHLQERGQSFIRNDDIEQQLNNRNNSTSVVQENNNNTGNNENVMFQNIEPGESAVNISDLQAQFRRQNYANMKKRRAQIQRNLRAIFIYPFSYILLWTFPIAADISQTHHELLYGPILWLTYIDTFARPMSCLVHSFVFIFKEKPWRYSWDKVEGKILMDRYMLKGEIGEDDMEDLCNSKLGKRGWFYRSTWNKKKCWKHQNNPVKRWCWYIGRFMKCICRLKKPDFYDNCNDELYWARYYYLDRDTGYPRSYVASSSESGVSSNINTLHNQHQMVDNKTSHHSYRQYVENASHNAAYDTSSYNNQSHFTNHTQIITCPEVKVPWYWNFLHYLPMLHGIDLDELNRGVRLRYTNDDDDFVIPGLSFALNTAGGKKKSVSTATTTNNKKANIPTNQTNYSNLNSSQRKSYPSKYDSSKNTSSVSGNRSASQVINPNRQSFKSTSTKTQKDTGEDGEVDLLAFLNDPSAF